MAEAEAAFPFQPVLDGVGMHQEGMRAVYVVDVELGSALVFDFHERIRVVPFQGVLHVFLAVDVDGMVLDQVERPHVVQASGVVLMVVGQEDGVYVADVLPQHLVAEIRASVHEYGEPAVFHQHGSAQPFVARVRGLADLAVASYHRHALGGAGTEEREFSLIHFQWLPKTTPPCRRREGCVWKAARSRG